MINITLPDGNTLEFDEKVTVLQVAERIGSGLAKAALAGVIDGKLIDLAYVIDKDVKLRIITEKDPEALEIIRHSTAHLMAHAVKQLFPEVHVAIGPAIETGFYYDFAREESFTPEDLIKIEQRMNDLVQKDIPIVRKVMTRDAALKLFKDMGEGYKVQLIEEIPEDQEITLYQQGNFIDLCRGPHVSSTGKLKAFKLTKLAGAYWRGDSNNEMLQRIYGTAFANKKDLEAHLIRLEEAEKRDHRKLGRLMDLFHFQEEAPGMAFWHANGWTIYQAVIQYMRDALRQHDYQEVYTPLMLDRLLWEKSGHWEKFGETNMFTTESENRVYVIKPMNCPGHIQIFKQGVKSYRDLPLKSGEFGICHRNEPSGTLHGLMRIRQFVQDDAHVFCTEEQLPEETIKLINLVYNTYHDFGFEDIVVRLATRPEKCIGSEEEWQRGEKALEAALNNKQVTWELAPGEGAFYGPKIEFHLRDCLDRVWQCGTIQIDFAMPKRLDAHYIGENGEKKTPVMIHRAILGSIERFIGILLEHYAGLLPLWLAPIQTVIMNITDNQVEYAHKIAEILKKQGLRVKLDLRNEKIGFKIREHTIARVPYLLVTGDREVETQTVAVRTQSGEDLGAKSINDLADYLQQKSMQPKIKK
jgi:threonyl-tRNA synthetase